ncbi:autoinducer binding domain-containing protein [Aestuariicoccus sp. MJ-SS9]|uniref:autoinducer binding domain-containing protein n=1 Tax=Aestuariicoccus sp. MJ-SS9 TaxID=3079855 RepID=UPI00290E1B8E|nr:autoinducer binding domain-containing protein [Aestuariicoccus sp. MJ-SS9]MDU8910473.1 autoinducer binding domain-containing protein [Aestuariicoccus sp. MJ-SS9]
MELIDLADHAGDEARYDRYLAKLCDELEFDYASYATANPLTGDVLGYATYPDEWKRHYGQSQMHEVDPTLYTSARSIAPVDWSRFRRDRNFNRVFDDAGEFGISKRGLTVPIRGPFGDCGLLSVTRDCGDTEWLQLKQKVIGNLQVAAVHIHDSVIQSGTLIAALGHQALSQREVEILQWCAMGKMQQDIADILTISHRTVEVHLRSARTKLRALTTAQAVGRGIALGMIEPG